MAAVSVALALTAACSKSSPIEPGPSPKPIPNIVASVAATAEALSSGGHTYRVTVKLVESGGAAATVSSIDLTFLDGPTTLATSHFEQPISDTTNVVPANATVDSRELMTTDEDFTHPAATSVVAKVAFTDGGSTASSASATAEIPAPAPAAYTLSGTVRDENSGRPISAGTVQILDGPNAGNTSSVDAGGTYVLSGLAGGSFMLRATANRYTPREQGVTIARDTTLDLTLRPMPSSPPPPPPPPPSPCSYTVAPSESGTDYRGGNLTATISRTSGNCSWQGASDVSWITFPGATTGNGSATLTYTIAGNGSLFSRFGNVTISWGVGSARIRVTQGHPPDWICTLALSKGPQDFANVPSAGGQLTVSASILSSPPGHPSCSTQVTVVSTVPWISGGGSGGPPGAWPTFTFTVAPNPSPGTARSGSIVATGAGKTETLAVTQR
jgi:Carboxypeptidase regulatory-like domain/Putative binding domain, N-terminal